MLRGLSLVTTIAMLTAPTVAAAQGSVIRVVKNDTPPAKRVAPLPRATMRAVPPPPPATAPKRALPLTPSVSTNARSGSITPWVTLTGSLIVGAIGAFFAVRTFNAIDAETEVTLPAKPGQSVKLPDEFRDQQKAVLGNGIAATVLLSSAAAGSVVSLIMLGDDD